MCSQPHEQLQSKHKSSTFCLFFCSLFFFFWETEKQSISYDKFFLFCALLIFCFFFFLNLHASLRNLYQLLSMRFRCGHRGENKYVLHIFCSLQQNFFYRFCRKTLSKRFKRHLTNESANQTRRTVTIKTQVVHFLFTFFFLLRNREKVNQLCSYDIWIIFCPHDSKDI